MDMIHQLSNIPLFQGLPEKQLVELAHIIVDRKYKHGENNFSVFIFSINNYVREFHKLFFGQSLKERDIAELMNHVHVCILPLYSTDYAVKRQHRTIVRSL